MSRLLVKSRFLFVGFELLGFDFDLDDLSFLCFLDLGFDLEFDFLTF